jgi:hypothetical protein
VTIRDQKRAERSIAGPKLMLVLLCLLWASTGR